MATLTISLIGAMLGHLLARWMPKWVVEDGDIDMGAAQWTRDQWPNRLVGIPIVPSLLVCHPTPTVWRYNLVKYGIVEMGTVAIWVLFFRMEGLTWAFVGGAVYFTLLFGIAVCDEREFIIPDELSVTGLAVGLCLGAMAPGMSPTQSLWGAGVGFLSLYLVGVFGKLVFRKDAMGGGDIKLLGMIGAFSGPAGVAGAFFLGAASSIVIIGPAMVWGSVYHLFLFARVIGRTCFVSISLVASGRPMTRKSFAAVSRLTWHQGKLASIELPYVPFGVPLAITAGIFYLWNATIVDWYRSYLTGL